MRSLDGPRLKLDRANEQIDSLKVELLETMESDEHKLRLDLKNETYNGQPAITLFVTDMPVFSPDISLTIGEIVHNLRSALGHLAWALVPASTMKGLTHNKRTQIEFPMAKRRAGYEDAADRGLPGVCNEHRAAIERYQPYRRSTTGRAMRALRALSNTDKHRVIVPAVFYPVAFHFNLKYKDAQKRKRIIRLAPARELELGAELLTWTFSQPPSGVSMDLEISASPGFRPSLLRPAPGTTFEDITGTLKTIHGVCDEILSHFEQAP